MIIMAEDWKKDCFWNGILYTLVYWSWQKSSDSYVLRSTAPGKYYFAILLNRYM